MLYDVSNKQGGKPKAEYVGAASRPLLPDVYVNVEKVVIWHVSLAIINDGNVWQFN